MAMADRNIDWMQLYGHSFSTQPQPQQQHMSSVSNSVTVVTTASPSSPSATLAQREGRVGKPTRKRTRNSRKNPPTLVNTDTSNFRAMVQQYTGVSVNNYRSTAVELGGNLDFQANQAPPQQSTFPMQFSINPLPSHQPWYPSPQDHGATSFFHGYNNNSNNMGSSSNERGDNVGSSSDFGRYHM